MDWSRVYSQTALGAYGQDHETNDCRHEPMDKGGDWLCVSYSILYSLYYQSRSASLRISESEPDFDRIYKTFDLLGPVPRICLDKLHDPKDLATYHRDLHNALSEMNETKLLDLIVESSGLSMGDISSKLFLIRRKSKDEV